MSDDTVDLLALDALFTPQGLLADRDGDGLVDAVRARFIVDGKAQRPEYAAAADIAARLAFASLSYTLPLAPMGVESLPDGDIPLFIGRPSTLASSCPNPLRQALGDLQPGEGLIAMIGDAEPALLVGGADDAGLAAAASAVATALPHLRIDDEMDAPALVATVRAALADCVAGTLCLEAIVVRGDSVVEARIHLVRSAGTTIPAGAQRRATEALAGLASGLPCALVLTAGGDREGDGRAPLARVEAGGRRGQQERSSPPRSSSASGPLVQARDESTPLPEPSAAPGPPVRSLAGLYGPEGFCVDTDADLLPDTCRTRIELPDDLTPATGRQAIHLAARIGLETLGLRFPLAQHDAPMGDTEAERAITIAIEPLADDSPSDAGRLNPGEGEVRLVPADAEGRARVVVRGGDEQGRAVAVRTLATLDAQPAEAARTLQDAEDALRRLCALADPAARAAAALATLDRLPPESYQSGDDTLELRLPVADAPEAVQTAALDAVTAWGRSLDPPIPVQADVERDAAPIDAASGEQTLTWEVDDVWQSLTESVFPTVKRLSTGADWTIDVRVSEPPGHRAQLRRAIMAALEALGLLDTGTRVHVRPAYRQGRAWLCEEVLPALHGRGVRADDPLPALQRG